MLRRFDFKLDCQYLKSTQVVELYKKLTKVRTLKEAETQKLSSLRNLTPGDFALLARRKKFQPKIQIRDFAINLLADENLRKQKHTPMGFIRP